MFLVSKYQVKQDHFSVAFTSQSWDECFDWAESQPDYWDEEEVLYVVCTPEEYARDLEEYAKGDMQATAEWLAFYSQI